mmetsp:Transcript_20487/g.78546  ORF Transcript_20487/g.78546 Transcript_20487/m.78546 type:complete len:355 (-) Transcript_20487:584-1648(-)
MKTLVPRNRRTDGASALGRKATASEENRGEVLAPFQRSAEELTGGGVELVVGEVHLLHEREEVERAEEVAGHEVAVGEADVRELAVLTQLEEEALQRSACVLVQLVAGEVQLLQLQSESPVLLQAVSDQRRHLSGTEVALGELELEEAAIEACDCLDHARGRLVVHRAAREVNLCNKRVLVLLERVEQLVESAALLQLHQPHPRQVPVVLDHLCCQIDNVLPVRPAHYQRAEVDVVLQCAKDGNWVEMELARFVHTRTLLQIKLQALLAHEVLHEPHHLRRWRLVVKGRQRPVHLAEALCQGEGSRSPVQRKELVLGCVELYAVLGGETDGEVPVRLAEGADDVIGSRSLENDV